MIQSAVSQSSPGRFLGFPLEGFSFFASALLTLATGFFTFFATTFLAIVSLLVWNGILGHTVNYADTYLYVGFRLASWRWLWRSSFLGRSGCGQNSGKRVRDSPLPATSDA